MNNGFGISPIQTKKYKNRYFSGRAILKNNKFKEFDFENVTYK